MAANLSDIAAMGGIPRYALVSLSLPGSTEAGDVIDLYWGMLALTSRSDTLIIGGNITEAPLLVINITVLGTTGSEDRRILTRSTASPGDKIAVTGWLGASAGGLMLLKEKSATDSKSTKNLKQAFLRPVPRISEGQILVRNSVKTAIDISDGLLADLGHICDRSRTGARIRSDFIPVHPDITAVFAEKAVEMALSGGEEYELLFTVPEDIIKRVKEALSCPVTVIGEVTEDNPGKVLLTDENGNQIKPSAIGWDHFRGESRYG
jgi:thiamine-monophosphate kinase